MTGVRFIHAADIHLDTPFKGLSNWNKDLALHLRDSTTRSFKRIIDLCIEENVDFLLICGDIFDSENKSLAAQITFADELKRLAERGIPTYFICGNHDPLSSWMDGFLQLPENVHRFGAGKVEMVSHIRDGKAVADIYGISYRNKEVTGDLTPGYVLKPDPAPFSIALLHGTVGSPGPHAPYAPFSVADISGKGFDYWALGHIHKHQVIRDADPAIVYPGNPQGRDFGETGPRGCYLVELSENRPPRMTFVPVQQTRFEEAEVDISGIATFNGILDAIYQALTSVTENTGQTSHILRIVLRGRTPLHSRLHDYEELRELVKILNERYADSGSLLWIDRIDPVTMPELDLEAIRKAGDFSGELLRAVERILPNTERTGALIERLQEDFGNQKTEREISELTVAEQREILEKAQWLLLDHFTRNDQ